MRPDVSVLLSRFLLFIEFVKCIKLDLEALRQFLQGKGYRYDVL